MAIRVPELIAYQNQAYARQYVDFVQKTYQQEQKVCPGSSDLSQAVAGYLFKLMAYKDEYEVARLHLKPEVQNALKEQFGEKAEMHYLLHPPILKLLGLKKKIKLGRWFETIYRLLKTMRGLRGTAFDIFGYDEIRKVERQLIVDYRHLIEKALSDLSPENYSQAVNLANLPDMIRGYDDIKLANVEAFWEKVQALGYKR
jgi:indolepyruvate ferredoxin oxidoreductase